MTCSVAARQSWHGIVSEHSYHDFIESFIPSFIPTILATNRSLVGDGLGRSNSQEETTSEDPLPVSKAAPSLEWIVIQPHEQMEGLAHRVALMHVDQTIHQWQQETVVEVRLQSYQQLKPQVSPLSLQEHDHHELYVSPEESNDTGPYASSLNGDYSHAYEPHADEPSYAATEHISYSFAPYSFGSYPFIPYSSVLNALADVGVTPSYFYLRVPNRAVYALLDQEALFPRPFVNERRDDIEKRHVHHPFPREIPYSFATDNQTSLIQNWKRDHLQRNDAYVPLPPPNCARILDEPRPILSGNVTNAYTHQPDYQPQEVQIRTMLPSDARTDSPVIQVYSRKERHERHQTTPLPTEPVASVVYQPHEQRKERRGDAVQTHGAFTEYARGEHILREQAPREHGLRERPLHDDRRYDEDKSGYDKTSHHENGSLVNQLLIAETLIPEPETTKKEVERREAREVFSERYIPNRYMPERSDRGGWQRYFEIRDTIETRIGGMPARQTEYPISQKAAYETRDELDKQNLEIRLQEVYRDDTPLSGILTLVESYRVASEDIQTDYRSINVFNTTTGRKEKIAVAGDTLIAVLDRIFTEAGIEARYELQTYVDTATNQQREGIILTEVGSFTREALQYFGNEFADKAGLFLAFVNGEEPETKQGEQTAIDEQRIKPGDIITLAAVAQGVYQGDYGKRQSLCMLN